MIRPPTHPMRAWEQSAAERGRVMSVLGERLSLPLIVAPMFLVANPALVIAACAKGLLGSFPAHTTRTPDMLDNWLTTIEREQHILADSGRLPAPFAVNLVVHDSNARRDRDLDVCIAHEVPVVLTSKSAPRDVVSQIHDYGGVVLHDVASSRHAEKALNAGVDGLIAVCGGAGGHTGTANPFAFVNELRRMFDGPLALSGGMTTGRDVFAATVMGADFAYVGTRFLATKESSASDEYKQMIVDSRSSDIVTSAAVDGAPATWLVESLEAAGIDVDDLHTRRPGEITDSRADLRRWKDLWSAGHGVGNISDVPTVAELCDRLIAEFAAARHAFGS